jgi:hypothetical protein
MLILYSGVDEPRIYLFPSVDYVSSRSVAESIILVASLAFRVEQESLQRP